MTSRKAPPNPIWLVKASWRGTSLKFRVQAKNENQAWHKGWGQVSRMFGGDSCMQVEIITQLAEGECI